MTDKESGRQDFESELNDCFEALQIMIGDVDLATNLVISSRSWSDMRSFARTMFASFEVTIYLLKQVALLVDSYQPCFQEHERMILRDRSYSVNSRGVIEEKEARVAMKASMLLAFSAASRAFGVENPLDTSKKEWESFQIAIKIRDRLTHPKKSKDLFLSPQEIDHLVQSGRYIIECFYKLAHKSNSAAKMINSGG
ncbi:hypothetical protein GCM10008959_32840 [Deinococcus seoulensis]|uniref:MAE-28990/MAE-18760-like HEPN domain-containing protein n=1 Tax=Deinococcus seoulensis TaxID=1837379 RepID=A0ABQ2RX28_9DEIO|nr:hypothetical protein [Deinococcus seoulensis]GGR68179.1 hypothetical protein GCM10008959_32840 [Deinococcus seoulensis]